MKTPPNALDPNAIADALASDWGVVDASLTYLALGFGSHHWLAEGAGGETWFVTADDLRSGDATRSPDESHRRLNVALEAARSLRDIAGLPFVVAPMAAASGDVLIRITDHFSMALYPRLDVAPTDFGEFRNPADRNQALGLVGQLHNASARIDTSQLRGDTLVIPNQASLLDAMTALDEPWRAGPYAEPARLLLRDRAADLRQKLSRFDVLAATASGDAEDWVVTHGEPHAGNIIRTRAGQLVVVDWDTVALAPRERDLWMLVNDKNPDWEAYREVTGVTSISEPLMDAYRLHWDLWEIVIYVAWCRRPHEATEEMAIAWKSLQEYLAD